MSQAQISSKMEPLAERRGHGWRNALIALVVVALVGGGWWAYQAGLVSGWLGQETTATVGGETAGGTNQPFGQMGAPPAGQLPGAAASTSADAGASGAAQASTTGTDASTEAGSQAKQAAVPGANAQVGSGAASGIAAEQAAGAAEVAVAVPTATVAATGPAPVASLLMLSGVDGATVRAEDGSVVAALDSGVTLTATGRSADGAWLAVQGEAGNGWVEAATLLGYGTEDLAVADVPAPVIAPVTAAVTAPALPVLPTPTPLASVAAASETGQVAGTATAADTTAPDTTAGDTTAGATTAGATAAAGEPVTARVTLTDARLNLRSGPAATYEIVAKANPDDTFPVVGRSADGAWLLLQLDDGGGMGWAAAAYLAVSGDAASVPVEEAAATAQAAASASTVVVEAAAPAAASTIPVAASTAAASTAGAGSTVITGSTATTGSSVADTGLGGTLVFQQSPGGTIYAYHLDTGELKALTTGFDPAISPDGQTVAFVRDGGANGLYLIAIDGSNERKIFGERVALSSPKWNADGSQLVFSRNDEYVECYQMGFTCLEVDVFNQRFPDGAPFPVELVKQYKHQLSIVNADGTGFHDVPALISARAPDWTAAGIVYQSSAGIQLTQDQSGFASQEVAYEPLDPQYYDPDWQPNGGQIAFAIKGAAQWDIWVVNPDGTGLAALTRPETTLVAALPSNVAPAYSPDGQHIVFLSNRTAEHEAGEWRLWVMDADGSNQRQLLDLTIQYSFGQDQTVDWGG